MQLRLYKSDRIDKPKLSQNQYAVGQAEYATGIVLYNDHTFYRSGSDISKAYTILDSFENAKKFASDKVRNHPEIECYIYDSTGHIILLYDKNGERELS